MPVTYEITQENAALPGLPPPSTPTDGAAAANSEKSDPDLAVENNSTPRDIILNETEQILSDYAGMLIQQANQ
jgi:hypothetical protein